MSEHMSNHFKVFLFFEAFLHALEQIQSVFMHSFEHFSKFQKSRNFCTIVQERQLERQLADASLSSGWTRMMGAVEGVTGLHRNRDGNTIIQKHKKVRKSDHGILHKTSPRIRNKLTWT